MSWDVCDVVGGVCGNVMCSSTLDSLCYDDKRTFRFLGIF